MPMKPVTGALFPANVSSGGGLKVDSWEIRPCGMVVQKRELDSNHSSASNPTIGVKVKYGSMYHEITLNSRASFGELKKMLAELTGLHPHDQKLIFKNKERESKAYLDVNGVKDRSKIVLVEDIFARERRYLELRKNAYTEKASKAIKEISLEVDKLADQVEAIESVVSSGGKVVDRDMLNLIELLMVQVIKLDEVVADGDVKLQRKFQVSRVQKYVETIDRLRIPKSMPGKNTSKTQLKQRNLVPTPFVVTTKWETFDSSASQIPFNPVSKLPSTATNPNPKPSWEFFE